MVPLVLQSSEARFFVELRVFVIDEVCGISTRSLACDHNPRPSADKLAKHHTSRARICCTSGAARAGSSRLDCHVAAQADEYPA